MSHCAALHVQKMTTIQVNRLSVNFKRSTFGLTHSSFPQRQLDTHLRSLSRLAFPFYLRADFPRSFADADAAEVAGLAVGLSGGVEAVAVIGDAKG